jgi:hypothetical protein
MKLTPYTTIVINQDVVSCDLVDEAAILNLKTGIYYGLDPVGARIWKLIQTPRQLNEILETLLNEYEVEKTRCQNDLIELLEQLIDKELVIIKE